MKRSDYSDQIPDGWHHILFPCYLEWKCQLQLRFLTTDCVDLSWLGSSSSINLKLLLSVQDKSFPSVANKARGTKINLCCQLASIKFNSGREQATLIMRENSERSYFISAILSACLCFTGFRALFQVFSSTFFTLAQRLTYVVLTHSSSKAVYFCWPISS